MKFYLRGIVFFLTVFLLLSGLIWIRYQNLYSSHLRVEMASFKSNFNGIVNTFQLVSKTIAEEVLLQEDVTRLVDAIVSGSGEQRDHYRGLLYRKLSPLYERVRKHSVHQLHFHFPDNRSMLRFHAPHKADDDLSPFRHSVRIANSERREVHGYESGKLVHGFRHVYPLSYRGKAIGSVEISNTFSQIYQELTRHNADLEKQYHLILLKSDAWYKLSAAQQENYHVAELNQGYLCENRQAKTIHQQGTLFSSPEEMRAFQQRLKKNPLLQEKMAAGEDFSVVIRWKNDVYSSLFHSIKNVDGNHAAYVFSTQKEDYLQFLQSNAIMQLGVVTLVAAVLSLFSLKLARAKEERQGMNDFLRTITRHMGQGLYATDDRGAITFMNREASRLLGYSEQESLERDAHEMFHVNDPQHRETGCPVLNAILSNQTCEQQQSCFRPKEGEPFPVELTCTPIRKGDAIAGTITLFQDISQRRQQEQTLQQAQRRLKKANRHLAKLANIDGLTKVANRRLFDRVLENLWRSARRQQKPISLLMMDIDHFKAYNDTYGHLQGDECLRAVAEIIQRSCLRPEDFVARYGGEEFVALLPDTNLADARYIAERICQRLEQQKIAHASSPTADIVTLSIGICCTLPDLASRSQILLDCGDRRLYLAKNAGRNQICSGDSKHEAGGLQG